jgi:hypothetical protein
MSGILISWYLLTIATHGWQSREAIRQSAMIRQLSDPVSTKQGARAGPKRDIYLIILDEYANAEVTGRLLDFDNRVFLDSLKQLGFYLPVVHSNYLHTFLSLPSLLNASQIARLSNEVGRTALDRTVPDYLEAHNRIAPFLKAQGYQFVILPTQYWDLPQNDPTVDRTMPLWRGLSIERELSRSMLRGVLKKTSLLRYYKTSGYTREQTKRILNAVNQVPKIPGPVFTFAHVMSPHSPYVFDRHCGPGRSKKRGTRTKFEGPAYVEQIECLNSMVLSLVTNLLRSSDVPPIIILQGDHGSKTLHFDEAPSSRKITLAQAKERLGALGAYYLPDGGREAFGDSVTVVNVMGNILRHYFGADLPPEPEDMYLSVDAAPYDFKRVDFAWLASEDWSRPSARSGMQTAPPSAK